MRSLALLACLAAAAAYGLVDHPIAADTVTYLDGADWALASATVPVGTVNANVPGDLLTDLAAAGVIATPLYELNFKNASIWDNNTWTYTKTFTATPAMLAAMNPATPSTDVLFVFDGIKMGANISLNGVPLGAAVDQFLRYELSAKAAGAKLLSGTNANVLTVSFDPSINVNGRFMACTGGWDWAPYSNTKQSSTGGDARTFSKGIWKSVYIATVTSAAITALVPHTFYNGTFPTQPLQDGNHAPFVVQVRVHLWAPAAVKGTVTVSGAWPGSSSSASTLVQVPQGSSNVTLTLVATAGSISLWWPVGLGGHSLYNVTASFQPFVSGPNPTTTRKIGFRFAALVTGNDTDPSYVAKNANADGTDSYGMRFRVNGAPLYVRGANMIPMDEQEGQYSAEAHARLVMSAADAGMNILRVWGGGVFLPDIWYDTCDELGVLVYHDMQFAQEGHSPTVCATQDAEFRHQIRRLSHHPSIAMWDGCNECTVIIGTDTGIYATFVLAVVVQEDKSRVVWPSCPAKGWQSGVNKLSAIPNDSPAGLIPAPTTWTQFEVHGPYQHGGGYPAVNGQQSPSLFPSAIPPSFSPSATGLSLPSVFTSETGGVSMSSFESMAPFLDPKHWGIHGGMPQDNCTQTWDNVCVGGNPMAERNYPCDNIIMVYFGGDEVSLNASGEAAFKQQLYQCLLGQALQMKSSMESHRATNAFGTMIWQLGEIWPTGGWGSLEYGTPGVPGQVIGGRWKPLHYFLKANAFADVFAACGKGGQCLVKNDLSAQPFAGTVTVKAVEFSTGAVSVLAQEPVGLPPGPGETYWFTFDASSLDGTKAIVDITVTDTAGTTVAHNVVAYATPQFMVLPKATVTFSVSSSPNPDGSVDISLSTDQVAVYVTLTTLAQGRFSDNAVLLLPPSATLQFVPFGALNITQLQSTLRVEHLAQYQ